MPIIRFNNGAETKIIGTVNLEKKEFSKNVRTSKHLHRVLDAWAVDSKYFHDVLLPGNFTIIVTDTEEHIRYTISSQEYSKNAVILHFITAMKDYGTQCFLPRSFWLREPFTPKPRKEKKKYIAGVLPKL